VQNNLIGINQNRGIYLFGGSENKLHNNTCFQNPIGIGLEFTQTNSISTNTISNCNTTGLELQLASGNSIINNSFLKCGMVIDGRSVADIIQTEVENNTVNGYPLVFWQHHQNETIDERVGQILLVNCSKILVTNQTITESSIGVLLFFTSDSFINDCFFINNSLYGIEFFYSSSNLIQKNSFINNQELGLLFHSKCTNNMVKENTFVNNIRGQAVDHGQQNVFKNNFWADHINLDFNFDGISDYSYSIDGSAGNKDRFPIIVPINQLLLNQAIRRILIFWSGILIEVLAIGIVVTTLFLLHYWRQS
jgi:parallel beta-helix repeat protein